MPQSLGEINTDLLLGTGEVTATGIRRRGDGLAAWLGAACLCLYRLRGLDALYRVQAGTYAIVPHIAD